MPTTRTEPRAWLRVAATAAWIAYLLVPVEGWGLFPGRPLGLLPTTALALVCWLAFARVSTARWRVVAIALALKVCVGLLAIVPHGFSARYYANEPLGDALLVVRGRQASRNLRLVYDALHERHGLRAVVTGGPGEEALCDEVARRTRHGAVSLAREERDLARLKALVRESRLLLVGDSGPRWYAAAFDVPCVSVLGPNDPLLTASSLEHARIVRRADLECSPCMQRVCPLGHHACMRGLEPARVLAAAEELFVQSQHVALGPR